MQDRGLQCRTSKNGDERGEASKGSAKLCECAAVEKEEWREIAQRGKYQHKSKGKAQSAKRKAKRKNEGAEKTFVCLVLWLVEQDTRERVMLVLRDKLVQTPSRKDGIAEDQEASLRQECVKFIRQMAGMFEM